MSQVKKVKEFIEKQRRLHVFFLPPRSPELNPDEQVWDHLKTHQLRSHKATTTKQLKKITVSKLRKISKDREKVKRIFKRNSFAEQYSKT